MRKNMYSIQETSEGWKCFLTYQDGKEIWTEDTKEKAVQSLISAARSWNGTYIREDDIKMWNKEIEQPLKVTQVESDLLNEIKRGAMIVFKHDHYLVRYRITQQEADLLIDIREGKKRVI